jgi:hypothetical protein
VINAGSGDTVWTYNSGGQVYDSGNPIMKVKPSTSTTNWTGPGSSGDPITTNVTEGFWYLNVGVNGTETWVENFSINP